LFVVTNSQTNNQGTDPEQCSFYDFNDIINWVANDSCGNVNYYTQTVSLFDTISPIVIASPDTTINSTSLTDPSVTGQATGTDNTGYCIVSYSDNSNQNPDITKPGHYNYTLERLCTGTDPCSNTGNDTQIITVQDTTKPWFTSLQDTYGNEWNYPINAPQPVGVDDNPEAPVTIELISKDTVYGNSDTNSCEYINNAVVHHVYKIKDPTGNFEIGTQNNHMQDTESPEFTEFPQSPLDVFYDGEPLNPDKTGHAQATDNSDLVNIIYNYDYSNQDPDESECEHYQFPLENTIVAYDRCSNSKSGIQEINVNKPISLIYTFFPSDITVPKGDTAIEITGIPQGIDTLNPDLLPVNYSHYDVLLEQTEHIRKWARYHSMKDVCEQSTPDSIQLITEDLDIGVPEVLGTKEDCKCIVSPNPADEQIHLSFTGIKPGRTLISLYNLTGQEQRQWKILTSVRKEAVLDMTGCPAGLYILRVETNQCMTVIKIAKQSR